jgi:transposase
MWSQAHAKSDCSALRRITVDETSARRGQRYVTPNVLDAENSRLLLMVEGRSAKALRAFAKALVEHGGDPTQIETIAMDMRGEDTSAPLALPITSANGF